MLMLAESQTRARGYLDVETVIYVLARFKQPNKVRETSVALLKHELIEEVDTDRWAITDAGRRVLHDLATRPIRKRDNRPTRYCV